MSEEDALVRGAASPVTLREARAVAALRPFWFIGPQSFVFVLYFNMRRSELSSDGLASAVGWGACMLCLWAALWGGEILLRRWELETTREAPLAALGEGQEPPSQRPVAQIARDGAQDIEIVLISWCFWGAASLAIALLYPYPLVMSLICTLVCWILDVMVRWQLERMRDARTHRAQLARLAAQLEEAGAHILPADDPRRVTVEQRFWRTQQELALSALQQRFADSSTRPPGSSLSYRTSILQILKMSVGSFLLSSLVLVVMYVLDMQEDYELPLAGIFFVVSIVGMIGCGVALIGGRLLLGQQQLNKELTFQEERLKIAAMTEEAGGLSLADGVDEALSGALSPDGTQGGELEQVGADER